MSKAPYNIETEEYRAIFGSFCDCWIRNEVKQKTENNATPKQNQNTVPHKQNPIFRKDSLLIRYQMSSLIC